MAHDLLTKVDSTVLVCDQTGDCGELIGLDGEGGGTFVSQTTGAVVEFSEGDVVVVDASIDNVDQLLKDIKGSGILNPKPVGMYAELLQVERPPLTPEEMERFRGHMKETEPLKDIPIRHMKEFNEESTQRVITPEQMKMLGEAIKIYMKKTAKPAGAERLSEGLKELYKDIQEEQKAEEEHPGEMIIMDGPIPLL